MRIPLVSVCMITYNHEQYIAEAIEGVLMQQTTFPIELVISDDCSTDNTRAIVMDYAEKHPDIIVLDLPDKNRGMMANFHHNTSLVRGKYIALCEGDDYWTDPLKLQKQVDFLEANPEYGMCYTKAKVWLQSKGLFALSDFGEKRISTSDLIVRNNAIPTLSVVVRRSLVISYDALKQETKVSNTWIAGDFPLWLYVSGKSRVFFIDEITCVYRKLEHSASNFGTNYVDKLKFDMGIINSSLFFSEYYGLGLESNIYKKNYCGLAFSYYGKINEDELKKSLSHFRVIGLKSHIIFYALKIRFGMEILLFLRRMYSYIILHH